MNLQATDHSGRWLVHHPERDDPAARWEASEPGLLLAVARIDAQPLVSLAGPASPDLDRQHPCRALAVAREALGHRCHTNPSIGTLMAGAA